MDMKEIARYATQIEKLHKDGNYEDISSLLTDLGSTPVTLENLQMTAIAKTLYQLVKSCPVDAVRKTAKDLLSKWKPVYSSLYEHKSNKNTTNVKECESVDKDKTEIRESVHNSTQHQKVTDRERLICNTLESIDVDQELTTQRSVLSLASPEGTTSLVTTTEKVEVNKDVQSCMYNSNAQEDLGTTSTVACQPGTERMNMRVKCVELLLRALTPDQDTDAEPTPQLSTLAHAIEKHIHALHGHSQFKYKACVRSRIANLKNPKSPHLRQGLRMGHLAPEVFARMSAEEMAGKELQQLREEYTAAGINEHQLPRGPEGTRTTSVRCRRCEAMDCSVTQVSRGTLFLPSWVRSSKTDEDVVTFVTCVECGEQWYHSRWVCL